MIDESMDKEQMKLPPQDWEFRSKPAWQRLIIMIGGVSVNVVLGNFNLCDGFICMGRRIFTYQKCNIWSCCGQRLLIKMGLRDGDKILSVDNKEVSKFYRCLAKH